MTMTITRVFTDAYKKMIFKFYSKVSDYMYDQLILRSPLLMSIDSKFLPLAIYKVQDPNDALRINFLPGLLGISGTNVTGH